jgi:hypothetical protein
MAVIYHVFDILSREIAVDEYQLIIEMEGSDEIIEIQYDPANKHVFNTIYDETGMPVRREVKPMRHNPIPLIREDLEQQIKLFNGVIE